MTTYNQDLTYKIVFGFALAPGRRCWAEVCPQLPDDSQVIRYFAVDRLSWVKRYDGLGTNIGQEDYTYDPHGRLSTVTNELGGSTSYLYDVLDRVIQEYVWDEVHGSLYTEYTYDSMGRVTVVREHDGTYRYNTYHPTGEVARTWGTRTYPVDYEYEMGRLKTLTTWQDFVGETGAAVTSWIYDSERGWLNQKKYADDTGPVYTYTAGGRLASRTWARGVSTGYDYDNAGRLVAVDYSDSTADVAYSYDRLGRRLTTTDGTGTRTDTHDVFGRLQSESYGTGALLEGWALNHAYDSLGRRTDTTLTHGVATPYAVEYGYDDASRLATVTHGDHAVAYQYYENTSRVWQQTYSKSAILLR